MHREYPKQIAALASRRVRNLLALSEVMLILRRQETALSSMKILERCEQGV